MHGAVNGRVEATPRLRHRHRARCGECVLRISRGEPALMRRPRGRRKWTRPGTFRCPGLGEPWLEGSGRLGLAWRRCAGTLFRTKVCCHASNARAGGRHAVVHSTSPWRGVASGVGQLGLAPRCPRYCAVSGAKGNRRIASRQPANCTCVIQIADAGAPE